MFCASGAAQPYLTFEAWRYPPPAPDLTEVAKSQNVIVKPGGLAMTFRMFDFYARKKPPSSTNIETAYRPYMETCIATFGVQRASSVSKGLSMITGNWVSQRIRPKGRWFVIGGQVNPDAWRHLQHYYP